MKLVKRNTGTIKRKTRTPITRIEQKREKKLKIQETEDFLGVEDENTPIDAENLPPYEIYEPVNYKDGPEGFIKWCEENVSIPIYPEGSDIAVWCPIKDLPTEIHPITKRSYRDFWDGQKEVARSALRMYDGRFVYRLIVFCWPRGDGKSLFACLIQLWKFFNWTRQQIVLGANSKEQITFVHYDIMRDIILNSPNLLARVGKRNILEKQIRLKEESGNVVNVIRAISSFSGIVSNITGYTFSEIFDMKNPKFFVQLDGSIRNIPNALGVIDSTVSSKQHILYNLYTGFTDRKSKTVYFSYRFSKKGIQEDYWNPNMTTHQLDDYRTKFPPEEFARYFLNTWGHGSERLFTDQMLEEMNYMGADGMLLNHSTIRTLLDRKLQLKEGVEMMLNKGISSEDLSESRNEIVQINSRFTRVEHYYKLVDGLSVPVMATVDDLAVLGDLFDTDWAILAGLDRADPLKGSRLGARTMFACIAKGLPGSRSRPFQNEQTVPDYLYVLLHLAIIPSHSIEDIKTEVLKCHSEYDGIDTMCGERWGIWDLVPWCEDNNIKIDPIFPTYDKQKGAFSELFLVMSKGMFKAPNIHIYGSKQADILKEEAEIFVHDTDKRWFGSPEKLEKRGVQDDAMFSVAWTIFGGRELNVQDFRQRKGKIWFGSFLPESGRLIKNRNW